jgi:cytochrome b pre-mRNA-processing protein 3
MFSALKTLFSTPAYQMEAARAYVTVVNQSRQPFFYAEYAVADTLDGRFDVIVLHLFLISHRLRKEQSEEAGEFNRVLQEAFFSDMDRNVREMGVSDTGVGKRIKAMAQAFFGRLQAYSNGLTGSVDFKESLRRNLYREASVSDAQLQAVHDYCVRTLTVLDTQDAQSIMRGEIHFI